MNFRGIVAIIIAFFLCAGIFSVALQPFFLGEAISDERSKNVTALIGGLIAVLAYYMGSKDKDKD